MTGGLLNLISYGDSSLMIYGNPKKSMFKSKYKKITNFGLQKFKLFYESNRELLFDSETKYTFKISRHADLLYDCYLSIDIPDIYSSFYNHNYDDTDISYTPYEFKWIEHLGAMMIKEIHITAGGSTLTKFSGEYLMCKAYRDYSKQKLEQWKQLIGDTKELNDPANAFNRSNTYPNAIYEQGNQVEPSIRGRTLYIPLSTWFMTHTSKAFPLISLQYVELEFHITLRKITDLYRIRNIEDPSGVQIDTFNNITKPKYIAPTPTNTLHQMYRFLQEPPETSYQNTQINTWNSNIHLLCTYIFLDNEERQQYAKSIHSYLFKDIYEHNYYNMVGTNIIDIYSNNVVANYMWRLRRTDAVLTNDWSNYTNWETQYEPPQKLMNAPPQYNLLEVQLFKTTGIRNNENIKDILQTFSILFDGKHREDTLDANVYQWIEHYTKSKGQGYPGLYHYAFELLQGHRHIQPSGGINLSKFKNIQFEFQTIQPPLKNENEISIDELCDDDGNVIAVKKPLWKLYKYTFDMKVFEERYNQLEFHSGLVSLKYAR